MTPERLRELTDTLKQENVLTYDEGRECLAEIERLTRELADAKTRNFRMRADVLDAENAKLRDTLKAVIEKADDGLIYDCDCGCSIYEARELAESVLSTTGE